MSQAFHAPTTPSLAIPPDVEAVSELGAIRAATQHFHQRLALTNLLLGVILVVLLVIAWLIYSQRPVTVSDLSTLKGDDLTNRRMSLPVTRVTGSVSVDQ